MAKYRKYYTLVTRRNSSDDWGIAFGDYRKRDVVEEAREYREEYTKIITTSDQQVDITAAVDALNDSEKNTGEDFDQDMISGYPGDNP